MVVVLAMSVVVVVLALAVVAFTLLLAVVAILMSVPRERDDGRGGGRSESLKTPDERS